ncbi:endonuclease/exonuclease/phosphatase family protein [Spirochaeta africana]|uniref:Metal-dependent hydrolase n=1 Tax=Spirochaeta africana (strain ATCC 700263 / DSM 8902 / Z-7692) TaxID=889378 RepID=H9UGC1_SPIAZ|nr:endonuclease/exonuclease/phosphatase family protein [Spirochaeta africana]AFG36564.1 metal-dependent hydrolase [Spirochaeta africana DSM 8902]
MKNHHWIAALLLGAAFAVCWGCTAAGCAILGFDTGRITIMTYNLHNLFDDVVDGSEYSEFCPERGGWDTASYHRRLEDFGRVIRGVRGTYGHGPDIVVLTEVENQRVVEDLRSRVLGERRYPAALATAVPGNAIQIGLLSRFPVLDVRLHAVYPTDGRRIRPILEAVLQLPDTGDELHLFACHWPSKIGGEAETEAYRLYSAGIIANRTAELAVTNPNALVMVVGDLNQTLPPDMDRCPPLQRMRDDGETVPARSMIAACFKHSGLVDYTPERRPLYVTGNPRLAATNPLVFFTPWQMTDFPGSFVFRDEWERIDHFLLGNGLAGERYQPVAFWVESRDWMLTPSGYPRGYRPSQRTGLSDHLPIVLELRAVASR